MSRITALLLAAGRSSRMGGPNKLLLKVRGQTLIRRTAWEIRGAGLSDVVVVTGHEAKSIATEIEALPFTVTFNERHEEGMHTSIRKGLESMMDPGDAFFVCLADQPNFTGETLRLLRAAFEASNGSGIFLPVHGGQRGQPVLISADFIPEILAHQDGDFGCSYLLKNHPDKVFSVPIPRADVLFDIDRPEDYEPYREDRHA